MAKTKGTRAWLVTWEVTKIQPSEIIVAVISSRRSEAFVKGLMEFLVLRAFSSVGQAVYCANRPSKLVYKAQTRFLINRVPHGERILCGHDPWLYGRKVSDLAVSVDETSGEEIVSWSEPPDWKWSDDAKYPVVEAASEPKRMVVRRPKERPMSRDIWDL